MWYVLDEHMQKLRHDGWLNFNLYQQETCSGEESLNLKWWGMLLYWCLSSFSKCKIFIILMIY